MFDSSNRFSSTPIVLWTIHSPFSFNFVWTISFSVGSPYGNVIGSTVTKCLTFHSNALFSGVFLTTETSLIWIDWNRWKLKFVISLTESSMSYTYIIYQSQIEQNFPFHKVAMAQRCKSLNTEQLWWFWQFLGRLKIIPLKREMRKRIEFLLFQYWVFRSGKPNLKTSHSYLLCKIRDESESLAIAQASITLFRCWISFLH